MFTYTAYDHRSCLFYLSCSCPSGYLLDPVDSRSCWQVNECAGPNECMHVCQDRDGGFECFCREGFQLMADGKSCQGIAPAIYI